MDPHEAGPIQFCEHGGHALGQKGAMGETN